MSRIGNKVLTLPAGVELSREGNVVTVKGSGRSKIGRAHV